MGVIVAVSNAERSKDFVRQCAKMNNVNDPFALALRHGWCFDSVYNGAYLSFKAGPIKCPPVLKKRRPVRNFFGCRAT